MQSLILFFVLACFVSVCSSDSAVKSGKNRVMVWVCLEFCQETQAQIDANFDAISKHKNILSAVSFEKYTLGPNSTLVDNHLTPVSDRIIETGLEAWPLLSSFPHPPEFIDWMRFVFQNPDPFIDACISEAQKYGYFGWNLDWEPTDNVTSDDGLAYATFISYFADRLHAKGLKLSADIATWSPIWNYTAIAATNLDYGISMGTYTSSDTSFTSQLDKIYTSFGSRSGVGLETVNASTEAAIPMDEVKWRFEAIASSGAKEVDLWKMPVPDDWWPLLAKFALEQ